MTCFIIYYKLWDVRVFQMQCPPVGETTELQTDEVETAKG